VTDRPQGKRSRFSEGEPLDNRSKFTPPGAKPSSLLADAESRGVYAEGPARLRVEWELLKKAGRDKPRNVRIAPEDMRRGNNR
jgi:hypothetical protein